MSIEELLKIRYKVVADYPKTNYAIGDIIECEDEADCTLSMWPHLFKKLEWWEERDLYKEEVEKEVIEAIPYLKSNGKLHGNAVYKVERFIAFNFGYMSGVRDAFVSTEQDQYGKTTFELRWFEPATEEEYNNYKANAKQKICHPQQPHQWMKEGRDEQVLH